MNPVREAGGYCPFATTNEEVYARLSWFSSSPVQPSEERSGPADPWVSPTAGPEGRCDRNSKGGRRCA